MFVKKRKYDELDARVRSLEQHQFNTTRSLHVLTPTAYGFMDGKIFNVDVGDYPTVSVAQMFNILLRYLRLRLVTKGTLYPEFTLVPLKAASEHPKPKISR